MIIGHKLKTNQAGTIFLHSLLLNCGTSHRKTLWCTEGQNMLEICLEEIQKHTGGPGCLVVASGWKWDYMPRTCHRIPVPFGHFQKCPLLRVLETEYCDTLIFLMFDVVTLFLCSNIMYV